MGKKVVSGERFYRSSEILADLLQEVAEGLLYAHSRVNASTTKTLEAASFLYALVELLSKKGFITLEELDERKYVVSQRLAKEFREKKMGAMLQDPEYNKYSALYPAGPLTAETTSVSGLILRI